MAARPPSSSAVDAGSGTFISDTRALVSFVHDGQLSMVPEPASTALLLGGQAAIGLRATRQHRAEGSSS